MKDHPGVTTDSPNVRLFPLHKIITIGEAASWLGIPKGRLYMLMILGGGPQLDYWPSKGCYIRKSDVDNYARSLYRQAGLPQQDFVAYRRARNAEERAKRHPFLEMASRDELHRVFVSAWGKLILLLGLITIMFSHSPWLHDFF